MHKLKAFVLMPFDENFEPVYSQIIKPALEEVGYEVRRGDSMLDQQNILKDVIVGIASSDLVVADVTTLNPNVLYELGICHALRVPTVMLTQILEEVPFDLRSYRLQPYGVRFDQAPELREFLTKLGREHASGKLTFGSPVSDFLPDEVGRWRDSLQETPSDPVEEYGESGWLDFARETEEGGESLASIMNEIAESTNRMTAKLGEHTAELERLKVAGGPGLASAAHRISVRSAVDMDRHSEELEGLIPEFRKRSLALTESLANYVNIFSSTQERSQLDSLRETVSRLYTAVTTSLVSIRGYRDSISHLSGHTRELTKSSGRLRLRLDQIIEIMERTEAGCARVLEVLGGLAE